MGEKVYTIKDIAVLAGVSKGTVDRVLHNRGKVSKKSFDKVDKVIKEIDFEPNAIARNLRINKTYKVCVLIPEEKVDSYWLPAYEGIKEATKEFKAFGILVEQYHYHPFKSASFLSESEKAIAAKPDALLMAPLFHLESLKIIETCNRKKIFVSLFNNRIDVLNTNNFIGQDLYQTGRVAANLVDKITKSDAKIAVIHINEESHMRQKEIGFRDYFKNIKTDKHQVAVCNLVSVDNTNFKKELNFFLKSYPSLSAIFVTNSKVHMVAELLSKKKNKISLIGYDLLAENVAFLNEGIIDFLIHQNPKRQAYLSLFYLAEHFLYGKKIPVKSLLPIDIITKENVNLY